MDAVILGINLYDIDMDVNEAVLLDGSEKGWQSLFDLSARIKDINEDEQQPTYQAVFWELKLDDVVLAEKIPCMVLS